MTSIAVSFCLSISLLIVIRLYGNIIKVDMERVELAVLKREAHQPSSRIPDDPTPVQCLPLQPLRQAPVLPMRKTPPDALKSGHVRSGSGRNLRNLSVETRRSRLASDKTINTLSYYIDDDSKVQTPSPEEISAFDFGLKEPIQTPYQPASYDLFAPLTSTTPVAETTRLPPSLHPGPPSRPLTFSLFPLPSPPTSIPPLLPTRNSDTTSSHARSDSGASTPLSTHYPHPHPHRPRVARVRSATTSTTSPFPSSAGPFARPPLGSRSRSFSTAPRRWSADTSASSSSRPPPEPLPCTPFRPDTPVRSVFSHASSSSPGGGRWTWRRTLSWASSAGSCGVREIETGETVMLVPGERGEVRRRPMFREVRRRGCWGFGCLGL